MESVDRPNPRKKRSNNRVAPPESLRNLLEQLKEEKGKSSEPESSEPETTSSDRVRSLREEIRTLRLELFGGQGGTLGMSREPMICPSPREPTEMEGGSASGSRKQQQQQLVSCRPDENEIRQSRAAGPPARPHHDSAMDQQQVHKKVDVCSDGDDDMKKEMGRGKSVQQIAREEEEMAFEAYRRSWEFNWGASSRGFFKDTTTVSSMHFTHCTPGCNPGDAAIAGATLQIFTVKLVELKGGLELPLSVYGVVAARDCVDHSRNPIFSCDRWRSQKLSHDEPFLRLTGPSRAIVFTDDVYFEIELKVKGKTSSQDVALISGRRYYSGGPTICFSNSFCRIELCMERIHQTVQATILGVRVKNGPWPFDYGGQVACLSPPRTYQITGGKVTYTTHAPSMEVVLLASRGRTMPKGSCGHLRLSRHVVSVELQGSLNVVIQAYSESGDIVAQGEVCFTPKACNISQETCFLGDGDPKVEVEITVAWSLLVSNRRHLMMMNGMDFDELKELVSEMGV